MNPKYDSLTVEQWQDAREIAQDISFLARGITDVTPFGGLTSNELAHLREDWITWLDTHVEITIPETDTCNDWKHKPGGHNDLDNPPLLERRDVPCHYCSNHGNTDGFEAMWGSSENTHRRSRTVILHRDIAEPAIDWLTEIFIERDRPELAVSPSLLSDNSVTLFQRLNVDRRYRSLMRTGIVIYAEYEVGLDRIEDLTPYNRLYIRRVLAGADGVDHPEIQKKSTYPEMLQLADELGTFTIGDLIDVLPINRSTANRKIRQLGDRGRIEKVDEKDRPMGGPPEYVYQLTGGTEGFECENDECEFSCDSIGGIKVHERRMH